MNGKVIITIALISFCMPTGHAQVEATQTVTIDTAVRESVALSGPWEMYWRQLLAPNDSASTPPEMVELPQLWPVRQDSGAQGYDTYRLKVILNRGEPEEELALRMPDVYTSYRIWINGQEFPGNGKVGKTPESTQPYWLTKVYPFRSASDTVVINLQIANFHHSKGGIAKEIYLGLESYAAHKFEQAKAWNTILFIALLAIATIVGSIYFVVQEKSLAMIFYIFLCLSWAVRVLFSNLYIGVEWMPQLDWIWVVRLEYISLYLTMVFGMLFIAYIFPKDVSNTFKVMYLLFGLAFTGFTLFTEPILFTRFVQIYLAFSALLLAAILVTIIRASVNGRAGALLFLLNVLFGVGMFGYVILAYQRVIELDEVIFSIGFLIMFVSTGIAMGVRLMRSAKAHDSDMLTFEQMYEKQ